MKKIILLFTAMVCLWFLTNPHESYAENFERVAQEVRADLTEARHEHKTTIKDLASQLAALERELAKTKTELARERSLLKSNEEKLTNLSLEQTWLGKQLEGRQAEMEEMVGLVRGGARDLLALAEHSPITAETPQRLEALRSYLDQTRFPGLDDIQKLVELYFSEISASGEITRRQGEFIDLAGQERQGELVRLGGFNTLYRHDGQVGYLQLGPGTGRLLALGGELPWRVEASLEAYLVGESPSVYMDISGGAALSRISRRAPWWEQILDGGPLIWPILAVGLAALILVLERLIFWGRVHSNTDKLMEAVNRQVARDNFEKAWTAVEAQKGRPTANVLKAGLRLKGCQPEVIQSGLAEAMLKEIPPLERFLSTLKVLAAVAPLLGLLGTVTGMINTFHVITSYGTGDPRLMAGGISEALVTTELGLAVAIPIIMVSSMLNRRAQHMVSDMEEKAAALTAALIKKGG